MIIKDERNLVPTKFKDLEIGDVYKLKGMGETFMKILPVYADDDTNDDKLLWNCIRLDDGWLDWTYLNMEVFKLKAELRVWD